MIKRPASLENDVIALRRRLTQGLLLFMLIAGILGAAGAYLAQLEGLAGSPLVYGTIGLLSLILMILLQAQITVQQVELVQDLGVLLFASGVAIVYMPQNLFLVMTSLTIIAAALLARNLTFGIVIVLSLLRFFLYLGIVMVRDPDYPMVNYIADFFAEALVIVTPFIGGMLVRLFNYRLRLTAERSERTARLLRATADTGQQMATLLNLNDLLRSAVDLIRDRFVFYHVQVYIVDEHATSATLAASTGEIGDKLLSRRYRVPINNSTIVGRVIQKGEPEFLTAADIATAPVEGAPRQSRGFEYALPIKEGEEIIGVLDVQALRPDAFGDVEQQALQVMSGQLATAIRNAKLFQSQEQNILENKKLFLETKTSLSEIQRLNRQLTRQSWDEYLSSRRIIDGVTLDGDAFRPRADWTERMREASQRRRAITEQNYAGITIAAPIELRGEVVGALEIEVPSNVNLEDMLDMLRPVAQRLAISLDNARLFEETQEATAQEQRISEIVSQYQSAGTVDDLLQITLEGLAETLGAEKASIRIGSPQLTSLANGATSTEETAQ